MGIQCDAGFEWCDSIVSSMGIDHREKEGHNYDEFEDEVGELLNKAMMAIISYNLHRLFCLVF